MPTYFHREPVPYLDGSNPTPHQYLTPLNRPVLVAQQDELQCLAYASVENKSEDF